jgi:hypothetical protein
MTHGSDATTVLGLGQARRSAREPPPVATCYVLTIYTVLGYTLYLRAFSPGGCAPVLRSSLMRLALCTLAHLFFVRCTCIS